MELVLGDCYLNLLHFTAIFNESGGANYLSKYVLIFFCFSLEKQILKLTLQLET